MKRLFLVLGLAATMLFSAQFARATVIELHASLSGANEFPANGSAGTGLAEVIIDTIAQTMHVIVSFAGLSSNNVAAHIHCCTADAFALSQLAPVATVTPTFTGFPSGTTAGSYDHLFDLTLASTYRAAFVTGNGGVAGAEAALIAGMIAGKTYVNIHTVNIPGGEIRGFLVPEPATIGLLAMGLAGLVSLRRRT